MPYGVCKKCGCTDTDPCFNPEHGNCWWVDESHELCSHCADPKIANDPNTHHCVNSNDKYLQSVAEVLVCKNCKHWHKDKDSDDVNDDAAWGECDVNEWGSYGSDSICVDFEEKEDEDGTH